MMNTDAIAKDFRTLHPYSTMDNLQALLDEREADKKKIAAMEDVKHIVLTILYGEYPASVSLIQAAEDAAERISRYAAGWQEARKRIKELEAEQAFFIAEGRKDERQFEAMQQRIATLEAEQQGALAEIGLDNAPADRGEMIRLNLKALFEQAIRQNEKIATLEAALQFYLIEPYIHDKPNQFWQRDYGQTARKALEAKE